MLLAVVVIVYVWNMWHINIFQQTKYIPITISKTIQVNRLQYWLIFIILPLLGIFPELCHHFHLRKMASLNFHIGSKQLFLLIWACGIKEPQRSIDQSCNGFRTYHSHPSFSSSMTTKSYSSMKILCFSPRIKNQELLEKKNFETKSLIRFEEKVLFSWESKRNKNWIFFYWIYLEDDWVLGIVYYFIWMDNMKWNRNENENRWLDTKNTSSFFTFISIKVFWKFYLKRHFTSIIFVCITVLCWAMDEWEFFFASQWNEQTDKQNFMKRKQKKDHFLESCEMFNAMRQW